ncbi:MAG: hypothetical protein AB7E09_00985 [Candidatus Izemoplasmatales bacterium]
MNKKDKIKQMILDCQNLDSPKITVVMPTHRKSPENRKDMILFKNLMNDVLTLLESHYPRNTYEKSLVKLRQLQEDSMFWTYNLDGLVIFACGDLLETFRLQYSVKEKISVAQAFHVQPIFAHQEIYGKHYLIDLAKDRFKMYSINQDKIDEMNDIEIKTSFSELYDDFDTDSNVNVGTYGGLSGMYHGHREKSEETKKDREKYFRYLDREFKKLHNLENSHFIFAGTSENISIFKSISQEPYYHEFTINQPLGSLKADEIKDIVQDFLSPLDEEWKIRIEKEVRKAQYQDKYLSDFSKIKESVDKSKIKTIIIKENQSMAVNVHLDELVNQVIMKDGYIVVFNKDVIDIKEDLAGIIR